MKSEYSKYNWETEYQKYGTDAYQEIYFGCKKYYLEYDKLYCEISKGELDCLNEYYENGIKDILFEKLERRLYKLKNEQD